jgi:hypothetical protein
MQRIVFCMFAFALVACEPEPTAIRFDHEPLVVQGMLIAGDTAATIAVFRAGAPDVWNAGVASRGVTDAVVMITQAADTFTLGHVPGAQCRYSPSAGNPDRGCYSGSIPGGVQHGRKYELTVRVGAATVRGSAEVPQPPVLREPGAGFAITAPSSLDGSGADPVVVRWDGVAPDALAELNLRTATQDCGVTLRVGPLFMGSTLRLTGPSAITFSVAHVGCSQGVPTGTVPALLTLSAYDANFSRYVRSQTGGAVREVDAAIGLTGAYGVFGAVASTRRDVSLLMVGSTTAQ